MVEGIRELIELQHEVSRALQRQVKSLDLYRTRDGGFTHRRRASPEASNELSKASTATCVISLVDSGKWNRSKDETNSLLDDLLLGERTSAGLPSENAFTVGFLAESCAKLFPHSTRKLTQAVPGEATGLTYESYFVDLRKLLTESLSGKAVKDTTAGSVDTVFPRVGTANIASFPPHPYLTQLVLRGILAINSLLSFPVDYEAMRNNVLKEATNQVAHDLMLLQIGSPNADVYSLAYAQIIVCMMTKPSERHPDGTAVWHHVVTRVMEAQRPDGSWPRSRPLFRYPRFGNAYCYEYEMLTQILIHATPDPMPGSLKALLRLSLHRLRLSAHSEEEGTHTWPSGHHPQFRGSESWSTASVYHFLHVIRELAANELRREVFRYLGAPSPEPIAAVGYKGRKFAPGHWDSDVSIDGSKRSLKEVIHDHVLIPISECISDMKRGGQLPKHIPAAGILFGPPGSAKTTLAKCIAEWLGWPCLKIDPSHVLGKGLDQLQTEANVLFEILGSLEQTVVLLDEFDEMVRERALTASEMRSRFLTTAMLPKLISIGERRRIVLLIATNHIDQFDIAIRRPGRFDFILQVMPPNAKAKIDGAAELVRARVRDFPEEGIATLLKELGAADQVALAALTYDEYVDFLMRVARQWPMGQEAVDTALSVAYSRCTLAQVASPDYRESRDGKTLVIHACSAEERHIRVASR